jgi:hypothetical protein
MLVLGALALTAQAFVAHADGTITGLSLNLPAIKTCAVETVTVNGTGQCLNLDVNFGDSSQGIHLTRPGHPINFPAAYHHVYSQQGNYTVRAQSFQDKWNTCPGTASATVQVVGPLITTMFLLSQVTPGGAVMLAGENFGNLKGQMLLHLKDYLGNPQDHSLHITQWGDTYAAGIIPPDISGMRAQQATLTVVAQCGAVSDALMVHFTPAVDVADLAEHTDRLDCSTSIGAGTSDQCGDWGNNHWPEECGFGPRWGEAPGSYGLGGFHASGWGFHGNGGNDQFWVTKPLQNDWVLDSASADWSAKVGDASQASEDASLTTGPGTSNPTLGVDWYVDNCGAVVYYGDMIITGPKGVPF